MYEKKIKAFGRAMAEQFAANAERGGWRSRDPKDNVSYLNEAQQMLNQLRNVVLDGQHIEGTLAQEQEIVIRELTADVANLMLIVAENCNALQYTAEEMGESKHAT